MRALPGCCFALFLWMLCVAPAKAEEIRSIRIGVSAPLSGILKYSAEQTHFNNIRLWANQVNASGGIRLKDRQIPIELVEYDDQSTTKVAIKNYRKLERKAKVHFSLAPFGNTINLATAPLLAKYGHPQIASTSLTDRAPQLAKSWPNSFWLLGEAKNYVNSLIRQLTQLKSQGKIDKNVALLNVANPFGFVMGKVAQKALPAAGFKIAYEKEYPSETKDFSQIIKSIREQAIETVIAFSYHTGTFEIMQESIEQKLPLKVLYLGVGSFMPEFHQRFKAHSEGVIGIGGSDLSMAKTRAYRESYQKAYGKTTDYWNSALVYASVEILQQAIERTNSLERKVIIEAIRTQSFDTAAGNIAFEDNINRAYWTVGQWRSGKYVGIESHGDLGTGSLADIKAPW